MEEAFGYLAGALARSRERWDGEVLELVRAVAVWVARLTGEVQEDEIAAWCRRHGLPCPELKHLFDRSPLGEWTYLRAGAWTFQPAPGPISPEWPRTWNRLPPKRSEPKRLERKRG